MHLVTLAESGLGIAEQEISDLFEPFVDRARSERPGAWAAEVGRRKQKLLKRMARRYLMPWRGTAQRDQGVVLGEYDKAWRSIDYGAYAPGAPLRDPTPWEWRGRQMFASDVGATRFRQLLLIRLIERVQPRRVLEVGCGNGINLILLAGRFPEIRFAGVELTDSGHRAARATPRAYGRAAARRAHRRRSRSSARPCHIRRARSPGRAAARCATASGTAWPGA
jgi:hypothetical protein